jgi:hypothetical protein
MVRSRISFCAASGSFHSAGSSDLALSSANRRVAASTSKMPPQQSHGLLDRFNQLFGFGAHEVTLILESARTLVREGCDVNVRRTAFFG